jgi:hypothetical protein
MCIVAFCCIFALRCVCCVLIRLTHHHFFLPRVLSLDLYHDQLNSFFLSLVSIVSVFKPQPLYGDTPPLDSIQQQQQQYVTYHCHYHCPCSNICIDRLTMLNSLSERCRTSFRSNRYYDAMLQIGQTQPVASTTYGDVCSCFCLLRFLPLRRRRCSRSVLRRSAFGGGDNMSQRLPAMMPPSFRGDPPPVVR